MAQARPAAPTPRRVDLLGVESAFGQVSATLQRLFGLKLSSDALERINTQLAERVANSCYDRPKPVAATAGEGGWPAPMARRS
jgi:hypothetical protein